MKRIRFRRKVEQKQNIKNLYPINEDVFRVAQTVSVVDENGQPLGPKPVGEALRLAREAGFDLVCVAPKAVPPVAKIMDYGSFKYKKEKELKKQRLAAKQGELKTIRLSLRINKHDLDFKVNQAAEFLSRKDKVRIELVLKGREQQYSANAFETLNNFVKAVSEKTASKLEELPKRMGGKFEAIIAPAA